jgi:hypothetical protein
MRFGNQFVATAWFWTFDANAVLYLFIWLPNAAFRCAWVNTTFEFLFVVDGSANIACCVAATARAESSNAF